MNKFITLIAGCMLALGSKAQSNNYFVSFVNEGQTYGINNTTGIKASAKVYYSGNLAQKLLCIFVNPTNSDTLILVADDEAGFKTNTQYTFSKSRKFFFYYKIAGKGLLMKSIDKAKNEIIGGNNFRITKFEDKPGGIVEGSFALKDIPVENIYGQLTGRINAITNGSFRLTINEDVAFGKPGQPGENANKNDSRLKGPNNLIFARLDPGYVIKRIFKPVGQNYDGYFRWKPGSKEIHDFGSTISDDGYMYTSYDTVLSYKDSIDKVIMFFATVTYQNGQLMDCHNCNVIMSCAAFWKQDDGGYRLNKFDTAIATSTEWGKPNQVKLIKIGITKYALSIADYDVHQGNQYAEVAYFDIENFNTIFTRQILDDNTWETAGSKRQGHSNETKIKFLPATNGSEYFILQAITTGTEEDQKGKIKPIHTKETYYFDTKKGEYVLQTEAIVK